jgi:MoxR-like ATPase
MSTAEETRIDPSSAAALAQSVRAEVRKAMVGQDDVIDQVLIALFAAGHVLIEGVPGLGKTLLVLALARSFDGSTSRIQFTPDLMPADVVGHVMYDVQSGEMRMRRGPVFTHLLLADEVNRAPAKTQAALLEVMQERQVTLEGRSMEVPRPFMTLATQNPVEQEGTYPLPEAQLDRFLLKVLIYYPSEEEELLLVRKVTDGQVGDTLNIDAVQPVVDASVVVAIQSAAARVHTDERVHQYAVRIARSTRDWAGVVLGAGPRGGLALIRAARAYALLSGRDFVTPDDIKFVALPALRHRMVLSPEVELEGQRVDDVLRAILQAIEAPRL